MTASADRTPKAARRARTPAVLQMEGVECGAAALGIIMGHYGRIVPLTQLRVDCGVSRDGSKASNILKAAHRHGMEAKGYSKGLEALRTMAPPFIVFWHFNHFVVVDGFRGERVYLNDPAVGHRTVSLADFDGGYTGVVLVCRPGPGFQKGGRRPSILRALRTRLAGAYDAVLYALLAGVLLTLPALLLPALAQVFLDQVVLAGHADWLTTILGAMAGLALLQGLLAGMQRGLLRRLRMGLSARLSAAFFWHLLRLPQGFYDQRFGGEVVGRSALNDKVAAILAGPLAQALIGAAMMTLHAVVMWYYDPVLCAVAFGAAAIQTVVLVLMSRRRVEDQMRVLQGMGRVGGIGLGALQNIETLKAGGREDDFFARWAGLWSGATNTAHEIALREVRVGVVPHLLGPLSMLLVLVLGGYRVIDGLLTIGGLVAFQMLMAGFLAPLAQLIGLGQTVQRLRADLGRLDDVLEHPIDPSAPASEAPRLDEDLAPLDGRIEVDDLTFGYSRTEPPLLRGLTFRVRPGERIALVGRSGSGKSTIARLLCGLSIPWSGSIAFGGRPRTEIPRHVLGTSLAFVDQDIAFFQGSVRDNLTLWDDTVPEQALLDALRDAEILDVVHALPGGLDGDLTEDAANLSGGQRQRLEIARALVNRPRILVLDEATSALDAETEHLILDRLRLRGCTCVLVAHRLSAIRDCEEIVVLDKGDVVERGTHDVLWRSAGAYADLLAADDALLREPIG